MTMRAHTSGFRIPKRLSMGDEIEDDDIMDSLALEKALPYVDYSTGVNNRLIERDPITGLGSLPREINSLEGSQIKRYVMPSNSDEPRNPILLQGDLGEEFNCLFTTKELRCKPRENRNILTLEGDLGEELDPVRPHGGRPRNVMKNSDNLLNVEFHRDPISGTGDFGREWDPIYKYQGRMIIKRPEQVKRDPITHSVPLENMGEAPPKNGKLYKKRNETNPIVSEEKPPSKPHTGLRMRRHSTGDASFDPIKHDLENNQSIEKPRCGLKLFPNKGEQTNPITHESSQGQKKSDTPINGIPFNHENLKPSQKGGKIRNPISGENIDSKEIAILWVRPENYHFRQTGSAKETPKKK